MTAPTKANIAGLIFRGSTAIQSWRRDDALEARDPEAEASFLMELVSALEAIQAENERLRKSVVWQPIESLPNDGLVMAYRADTGRMIIVDVAMLRGMMHSTMPYHLQFPATHWMPLPSSPALTESEEG
jgi:hypothetical protein